MVMVEKLFLAPTGALGEGILSVRVILYAQKGSYGIAEVFEGSYRVLGGLQEREHK